jgi:hypothetical protein
MPTTPFRAHERRIPGLLASGDLSANQYRFVRAHVTPDKVQAIVAASDRPIGVQQDDPSADGKTVDVVASGITEVVIGAAVAYGDPIQTDAFGRAVPLTATGVCVGYAMQSGTTAGERISAYVNCVNPPGPDGVASFTMTAAPAAPNVTEVTITAKDRLGNIVAAPLNFDVYLSDSPVGQGLTATTASGTVTAKAASGAVIDTHAAKKALRVQSLATGVFVLEITDAAKTAFKVVAQVPGTGQHVVGITLAAAAYGA